MKEKFILFTVIILVLGIIFFTVGTLIDRQVKKDKPETNVFQINPVQSIKLVKVKLGYCVSILENRGSITTVAMNRIPCSYLEDNNVSGN